MKSSSCWSWASCSSSFGAGDEPGTTKVVRKITKNGETVTTTTTYNNHSSATKRIQIDPMDSISNNSSNHQIPIIRTATATVNTAPINAKQFEKECLAEHNRLRALHGCPPLKLNNNLSKISKQWAVKMANSNSLQHSKGKYGENLYMCSGKFIDGKKAVESWYNEIKDYNFNKPDFGTNTGHFTQVVWKDSKELGIGVEIRGNSTWVVANYDPPGNYTNCYQQNVPRI